MFNFYGKSLFTRNAKINAFVSFLCIIYFITTRRKTLHHPTRNIAMLEQRLNAIEFFLDLNNQSIVENLTSCLRHVYRLTNTVLICCSGPQAKPSNWYKLYKVQFHSLLSLSILLRHYLLTFRSHTIIHFLFSDYLPRNLYS